MTLFDVEPDPPAQRHSGTSVEAAEGIRPSTNRLRMVVLTELERVGPMGLTDEEIIDRTGLSPSTARPRRIELVQGGQVRDSGGTRQTRSGRRATVWVATRGQEPIP